MFRKHRHEGTVFSVQKIETYGTNWWTDEVDEIPQRTKTRVTGRCDECGNLFQITLEGHVVIPQGLKVKA